MSLKQVADVAKSAVELGRKIRDKAQSPEGQAVRGALRMTLANRRLRGNPGRGTVADRENARRGADQLGSGLGKIAVREYRNRKNPPQG